MRGRLIISSFSVLLLLLINNVVVLGQQKKTSDPFDLSASEKLTKELGVPSVEDIAKLETKVKSLLDADDCGAAIPVLDEYARKANWLANLISAGIQPYYGASYDEQKHFADVYKLASLEQKANEYKAKRNHAMVMQGECFAKLGNKPKATALLVQALDLIDIKDRDWWQKARTSLYSLIGLD